MDYKQCDICGQKVASKLQIIYINKFKNICYECAEKIQHYVENLQEAEAENGIYNYNIGGTYEL